MPLNIGWHPKSKAYFVQGKHTLKQEVFNKKQGAPSYGGNVDETHWIKSPTSNGEQVKALVFFSHHSPFTKWTMPPRHHGNVSLRIEHARVRKSCCISKKVKSNEKREQRLQAQIAYQRPHT